MDVDPSRIPVEPPPFEYGLRHFAEGLIQERVRIVAIGSSSTAGERDVKPYPPRLKSFLEDKYPNARITLANKGVNGEEAPAELARFDRDVIAENPHLVIWQVGTNAVWQSADQNPPSIDKTKAAIREGLVKLRNETQADVILMDLQYLPALLTPAKQGNASAMVRVISEVARDADVNVFRRFAFMKGLLQTEHVSFDRMTNPDDEHRLHQSDWVTNRVAWAMRLVIAGGVDKANAPPVAKAKAS